MIDLLVLNTLQDSAKTLYGLRKKINEDYSFFLRVSLGSLHPVMKKLEDNKYVDVERTISSGGQRSSKYSITPEGKQYFIELMQERLPENPTLANQIATIKISAYDNLDSETKVWVKDNIIAFYYSQKDSMEKIIDKKDITDTYKKFIKYEWQKIDSKIQLFSVL